MERTTEVDWVWVDKVLLKVLIAHTRAQAGLIEALVCLAAMDPGEAAPGEPWTDTGAPQGA